MRSRIAWFAIIAALPVLNAQVIRVQTREVIVDVTVTDGKNVAVPGLEKRDFTVLDDGKPRVIDGFEINQEQPLVSAMPATPLHMSAVGASNGSGDAPPTGHSSAIILDEVNSFFEDAARTRGYTMDLLNRAQPDERIALYIIVWHKGLVLLQDYTTDRDALKRNLARHFPSGMRSGSSGTSQPGPPGPHPPADKWQADLMWRENSDAARLSLQTLAEELAPVAGRKSIFWLTNAFPPQKMKELGLEFGWEKTFAVLNEADVAVNVIDSSGLTVAGSNQVIGTLATMRQIADATGGNTYFNRNDLDGALVEGIAASRSNYSLRFHLAGDERDSKYHALRVKVDRPGVELYYRQGYYAGDAEMPVDLVAGKVAGQALESRAAGSEAGTLDAAIQLPYFYTGTNRADVHLSLEVAKTGAPGPIEIVGIALRPDGSEAARFADTVTTDVEHQRGSWRYEHRFTVPAGTYVFRIEVGAGATAVSKKEVPLTIEPWKSSTFGIGGIALSTDTRSADGPTAPGALIAGGKEFVPSAANRFQKSALVYFYTEIYDPASAGANALTMEYKILDQKTGEVKMDTGIVSAANYVRPDNPVVPFATRLQIAQLTPGFYRLEVRAGHSSDADVAVRNTDFEVN